jgi:hypothetical protein
MGRGDLSADITGILVAHAACAPVAVLLFWIWWRGWKRLDAMLTSPGAGEA